MAVAIKSKPSGGVSGLFASREPDNYWWYSADWKCSSWLTNADNSARAQNLDIRFKPIVQGGRSMWPRLEDASTSRTHWGFNLNSFDAYQGSVSRHFTRASFYPVTKLKILGITTEVRATNSKGAGPWVSTTRNFGKPTKPSISAWEMDDDSGIASITVNAWSDNGGHRERYDTRVQFEVYDSYQGKWAAKNDFAFTGSSRTITWDVWDRGLLNYSQYVMLRVRAMSRGIAGMSDGLPNGKNDEAKAWTAWRTMYVAYPSAPTIKSVDIPDTSPDGKITVQMALNVTEQHPVEGVRLEVLRSVDAITPEAATASDQWVATGIVDNGRSSALALPVSELPPPDAGKHTWLRVATWNEPQTTFVRRSAPIRITELESSAEVSNDKIDLISLTTGDDGNSVIAVLGWHTVGTADTGTEVSWSKNPDAWRSTDGPKTHTFIWSDGAATIGGESYDGSATLHITGLDEAEPVYVRARRYLETDTATTYSDYSTQRSCTPVSTPESATLMAPDSVADGQAISLSWTYDSDAAQRTWQILTGATTFDADGSYWVTPATAVVLADGTGTLGSTVIPYERYSPYVSSGTIPLAVRVSTGGTPVDSEAQVVTLATQPTLSVTASTVTAQPMSIGLSCSVPAAVSLVVSSDGSVGYAPSGEIRQSHGDCVWSGYLTPEWTAVTDEDDEVTGYTSTVVLPTGIDLWDGVSYTVTARATDESSGLSSDEATATALVNLTRKAPDPSDSITVTPSDTTDGDGIRTLSCAIYLPAPTDGISTDAYDLYRVTPDGVTMVAGYIPAGTTVIDHYAPYASGQQLAYRAAYCTIDGSVEWADYPYTLAADMLRIDFGERYVELPYNLAVTDTHVKDFESRAKLDGSVDGYWGPSVARTGGFSSSVYRVTDQETADALAALAEYSGACFVRMPTGAAYDADIEVSNVSDGVGGRFTSVTINATAIDLTAEHMATVPLFEEESE